MNPVLVGLIIVGILLVYLIATHKIDVAHLKAEFASVKDQLHLTHAAALSVMTTPLTAVQATTDSTDLKKIVSDAIAAAAPAATAAPVNPFIAWKAAGKDMAWCILQGLGGVAPTDAQWAQAIAAGYTKDSGPQPGAPENEVARDFSAPVLDYEYVRSRDMTLTGPVAKTVTNCPTNVKVKTAARSGAVLKTPYWVTVNGVRSSQQDNAQATYEVDVSGPSVVVSIDQQTDSVIDLWIA